VNSRLSWAWFVVAALLLASTAMLRAERAGATVSARARFGAEYVRPSTVPYPSDNAPSQARELLGRTLFFDTRLSGSSWIACASCHNPGFSWGDGLPLAVGNHMRTLGRRTPTILNLAWAESLFWDGRAGSLEEQALGPVQAEGEMNLPLDQLMARLNAISGYKPLFDAAYPGEAIVPATVAKAIAAFERTIVSGEAPFDRWLAGDDAAIDEAARRGFAVFNEEGRCAKCHSGWRFTDDSFHDIGVVTGDPGRGALLTNIPVMRSAFKTPTLRNVDRRAPYLHNGSAQTLEEVIDLYDRGGLARRDSLSPAVVPLGLTAAQKGDLLAFLRTLSSDDRQVTVPVLPR
jgi:cytochrome c peroxidase